MAAGIAAGDVEERSGIMRLMAPGVCLIRSVAADLALNFAFV
jgi:hypothetical protein